MLVYRVIDSKSLRLITEESENSPSRSEKDYIDGTLRGISSLLVLVYRCLLNLFFWFFIFSNKDIFY